MTEQSAGGVVIRGEGAAVEVAIIRPRGRAVWALPKGHANPGETLAQAAVREVFEETGLKTELVTSLGQIQYVYQFRGQRVDKTVVFFLLRAVGGEIDHIDPSMRVEVDQAKWIPLLGAERTLTFPGERDMVVKAAQHLAATP